MSFEYKKSLGQHFLNNRQIPKRMADAAEIRVGDTVLEIGPGIGVLTRELLARGAEVIALEADRRAIAVLEEAFKAELMAQNLTIIHADARQVDLTTLGLSEHAYKVVANIPYYLSGLLFRSFLESTLQPSDLVFLVQKEVALRIARDTKESLLSLSVKAYGRPVYVTTVARGNFTPTPKVDSAILSVRDISHSRFGELDEGFFFSVLHAGFASKRKQLLGNLTAIAPRDTLMHIFSTLNIPLTTRGEDLSVDTWLMLAQTLFSAGFHRVYPS
jgi:16S rRNA (adenine1518-N6/adenine1519-N6)-dimethyltransferase